MDELKVLTRKMVRGGDAISLADYERDGGYQGLRKALEMEPAEITALVKESNLRGRGGGGFPAGMKWSFVPTGPEAPTPKYVVINCDEMEPGTCKDRQLLWGNPHQILEGILIAGHAIEAQEGFVFVRWAYQLGADRLDHAIQEARAAGYVGDDILGSGYSCDVHVHTSAGRYICGEETALLNSLEGKRPNPRMRPPFPAIEGLWARPTLIQNVETISCVPHILVNGALWFNELGADRDAGTKLYCVSGRVQRPGVYELPIGVTLRELLFDVCGGMQAGREFRAAIPGGAAAMFMPVDELDVRLDFSSLAEVGNRLGPGGVVVFDESTCVVGAALNLEDFFARESCGWCTPCRDGLPWIVDVLRDIEEGRGQDEDIDLLVREMKMIGPNAFCALAAGAEGPLVSVIEKFREEFEEHVRGGGCPQRVDPVPADGVESAEES